MSMFVSGDKIGKIENFCVIYNLDLFESCKGRKMLFGCLKRVDGNRGVSFAKGSSKRLEELSNFCVSHCPPMTYEIKSDALV